jgi:hypothetical protein
MLRYRLRTLLIVLALGPPVIAGAWMLGALLTKERNPSPWYIYDGADVNYQPPGPVFKLNRELVGQRQIEAATPDENRSPLPRR